VISRARVCALLAAASLVPRRAGAQAVPSIRACGESNDVYGEFLYGLDGQIFSRAGLGVDVALFRSAGAIMAALAGGALDVGLTDALGLANAVNRGLPLVAIAGSGFYRKSESTNGLCVASTSPVRNAKGFEGQTIALATLVSEASVTTQTWLARNGADVSSVHFVEMPFSEMLSALQRRTVAGAYLPEPFLSQAGTEVRVVGDPSSAVADRFLISLVVAPRAWLSQNAETARSFVAAVYETARWSNQNREQTASILAKYSKIDVDVIRRVRRILFATALEPSMLQPLLDAAFTYKAIDRPTNAADLMVRI
jgi:NitT/TauT family transport system substrate-binding protein